MSGVANNNKASLKVLDEKFKNIEIYFQYNPDSYSIEKTVSWNDQGEKKTIPELQFINQGRKTLSFNLFFDTYEQGTDVRDLTKKVIELSEPMVETQQGKGKKRPPICLFAWGNLCFKGVVERVTQNYTMFLSDGKPVRARLTISMKQFSTAKDEAKGTLPGDPEKIWIVKEGDQLSSIAAREYGSPFLWRVIADKNNIINPRLLTPGQVLILPALE